MSNHISESTPVRLGIVASIVLSVAACSGWAMSMQSDMRGLSKDVQTLTAKFESYMQGQAAEIKTLHDKMADLEARIRLLEAAKSKP
jgi:cell division protein FtsL